MTSCRRSSGRSSSPVVGSGRSRKGQVRVVLPFFFFAFRFCEFCVVTARSVLASSHPQLPLSTASFTAQLLAGSTLDRKRSSGCPILQREKRQCSVPFVWCPPCVRVGAIFQPNLRNQFFFAFPSLCFISRRICLATCKICILVFVIIFIVLPLIFKFSFALQKGILFLTFSKPKKRNAK